MKDYLIHYIAADSHRLCFRSYDPVDEQIIDETGCGMEQVEADIEKHGWCGTIWAGGRIVVTRIDGPEFDSKLPHEAVNYLISKTRLGTG